MKCWISQGLHPADQPGDPVREKRRDRELLTIAEDGVISPEERPLYEEIVAELDGLIQAAMELKVAEARELQE